ncbi:MAG: alpha-L-fucosidase [Verrucomicrobiales bacterium]
MRTFLRTVLPSIMLSLNLPVAAQPFVHRVPLEPGESPDQILGKAANLVPSPRQLAFHELEFTCFIHFGPNTFTGVEWGNGKENPAVFHPGDYLDTDQWCRVAKEAGMRMMLITVKHHDGFCLWQTRYNDQFSVRGIRWRDGKGDVLRELADSCRKHDLKLGVYLSPADLYQIEHPDGLYGNQSASVESVIPTDPASFHAAPDRVRADKPADSPVIRVKADDYNRYFMNQLYELLTEYGPIHEVWFDGAHPKRKGNQQYLKQEWFDLIRQLAPEAVIFGGPDVRWCGNEAGRTRAAEWNIIPVQGESESGVDRPDDDIGSNSKVVLPEYKVYGEKYAARELFYLVPEINTSIRAGWFWRNEHEQAVRSPDDIFDIYERAAGGNGVFLLNVPPDKSGRIAPRDEASLKETGRRIRATYGTRELTTGATSDAPAVLDEDLQTYWQPNSTAGEFTVRFPSPRAVNRVVLQEAIGKVGQRVIRHAVDAEINGKWQEVATAETIGYKRILRFPSVKTSAFRVRILESRAQPTIATFAAHLYQIPPPSLVVKRGLDGLVVIQPPATAGFSWKPHGQGDPSSAGALQIHYTTDGSAPTVASPRYEKPILLPDGGRIRAIAIAGGQTGPACDTRLSIDPTEWKIHTCSSEQSAEFSGTKAIDGDPSTFWHSRWSPADPHPHLLEIDLGRSYKIDGLTYLPRQDKAVPDGMVEAGEISLSLDGKSWTTPQPFRLGNLVNDPSERTILLDDRTVEARFVRFKSSVGAAGKPYAAAAEIGVLPAP